MNSIAAEINNYNIVKNRTGNQNTATEVALPISLDSCLINTNNNYYATADTFNNALSALYINYLYTYGRCFLIKNNFPSNTPAYIGMQQLQTPSVLTITDINPISTATLLNIKQSVNFTVQRFIENYTINIPLSTSANPPLTSAKDLAYTYVHTLTSLQNSLFIGESPLENSGSYTVSLTGLPSVSLNQSFSTNPSDIFLTTSTFTSNSGSLYLAQSSDINYFTKFSNYSNLSAEMDDLVDVQVGYNSYTKTKVIFCAGKTTLFFFTDDDAGNISLVYSGNTLGYKRDINLINLSSLILNGTNLYISDSHYNALFKIDVSGFLINDPVNSNRVIVNTIVGGTGTGDDKTQFSNPEIQFIHDEELYVYDRNNKRVKVYDLDLNFIRQVNLTNLFKQYPPIQTIKPFHKTIDNGVLSINLLTTYSVINTQLFYTTNNIVKLDANTFKPQSVANIVFNTTDEKIISCVQSPQDRNINYIATNKSLYKFNNTNFSQIGYFDRVINSGRCLAVIPHHGNDDIYFYGTPGYGVFIKYVENVNYTSLLTNSDFQIYTATEIFVKPDENQTFFVYNKVFNKLLYNFSKLLDNITFQPTYTLQIGTNLDTSVYNGLKYLDNSTLNKLVINETKDYFIGENEIFCNSVVNRVIRKFYDLLTTALTATANNITVNFNTITLPSNIVPQISSVNNVGAFIVMEKYIITPNLTGVIVTEDGRSIVMEGTQGVTSIPTNTSESYTNIDQNVTVVQQPIQQDTPFNTPRVGKLIPINSNLGIISPP